MNSCGQHDAGSVIAEQRMFCQGKVVSISYVSRDEWGTIVSEGVTTVCEAHMPSFLGRGLEQRGYTLGEYQVIGVIEESLDPSPIHLESEH